uniref:Profilin family member 4 n=1 Tax=Falco tinnunculus TaxID=100819 RepID=A0A8C4XLC6_FALTI
MLKKKNLRALKLDLVPVQSTIFSKSYLKLSKTMGGWKAVHHCKLVHFWSSALNLIYTFYKNLLQVRRGGLCFKEAYYKCVHADEHSMYLQNVYGGLIVVKTKTFILLATYRAGMYPSVCVEAAEKLVYMRIFFL